MRRACNLQRQANPHHLLWPTVVAVAGAVSSVIFQADPVPALVSLMRGRTQDSNRFRSTSELSSGSEWFRHVLRALGNLCCEVTTACQHTSPLRHLRSSSRCVADFHRNVGVSGTDISLSTSGKAAPKQTNQKTKTPRSHTHTGSTTHVIRDPEPDSFGASSSSSQAHLLQTLLAPTCCLVVPLLLC